MRLLLLSGIITLLLCYLNLAVPHRKKMQADNHLVTLLEQHKEKSRSSGYNDFIRVPLKKNKVHPEQLMKTVNEIAKHQAILLQKQSYQEVKKDVNDNKFFANMLQINGVDSNLNTKLVTEKTKTYLRNYKTQTIQTDEDDSQEIEQQQLEKEDPIMQSYNNDNSIKQIPEKSFLDNEIQSQATVDLSKTNDQSTSESSIAQPQIQNKIIQQEQAVPKLLQSKAYANSKKGEKTKANLGLKNHQNTFFTGQVAVGDKDDVFDIIFDTGSTLTFINSVHCDDRGCVKGTQYNSTESDTHKKMDAEVQVEFGSGSIEGILAKETFFINGMEVPDTLFIEITKEEGEVFSEGDFDGIVGLSFPDLADDTPTLFDFMIQNDVLSKPQFGFYMNRESGSTTSQVTFGGYDEKLMLEKPFFHNVSKQYYWSLACSQILVGNEDTKICSEQQPCEVVVDSGTSLFTGPSKDLRTLLSKLDSGDGCKGLYDLPTITFVIDNIHYDIYPEEYILTVTQKGVEEPHTHSNINDIIQCVGAFYSLDIDPPVGPLWVLGDIFMSKYYSVFDRGTNQIGLALADIPSNRKKRTTE